MIYLLFYTLFAAAAAFAFMRRIVPGGFDSVAILLLAIPFVLVLMVIFSDALIYAFVILVRVLLVLGVVFGLGIALYRLVRH